MSRISLLPLKSTEQPAPMNTSVRDVKVVHIPKWDNIKFLLILLVVIGHFAEYYTDESRIMKSIFIAIYTFHMPVFIFIFGLFSKSCINGKQFKTEKVLSFFILYLALKVYCFIVDLFFVKSPKFNLFYEDGIPWYLFATAAFLIITYILKDIKKPYYLFAFSIIMAVLAGFDDKVNDYFTASRIIVYYPFFLAGYYLESKKIMNFIKQKQVVVFAFVILISFLVLCFSVPESLYQYRELFTARNPYSALSTPSIGWILRILYYPFIFIIGLSVITLIPNKNLGGFTRFGARTLQVYFIHNPLIYICMKLGFGSWILGLFPSCWEYVYLSIAILYTLFLSLKFFSVPFDYVSNLKFKALFKQ